MSPTQLNYHIDTHRIKPLILLMTTVFTNEFVFFINLILIIMQKNILNISIFTGRIEKIRNNLGVFGIRY